MSRIIILGNAGGGKSTLARKLGEKRGLRHVEIDRFLWQQGWILTPPDVYAGFRQSHHVVALEITELGPGRANNGERL